MLNKGLASSHVPQLIPSVELVDDLIVELVDDTIVESPSLNLWIILPNSCYHGLHLILDHESSHLELVDHGFHLGSWIASHESSHVEDLTVSISDLRPLNHC